MLRLEDERLITGRGHFAGDIKLKNLLHLGFCRSPLPHARITGIDTTAARAMPGVVAVWTADDLPEASVGINEFTPPGIEEHGRPILSHDEVNYVGEAYALVVAESAYQVQDAVAQVFADFVPLSGVGDVATATCSGAPRVHADMQSNIALTSSTTYGDIEAAFADDSVTATIKLSAARVAGAAMEPRTVTAQYARKDGTIRVWTSTQSVFAVRSAIAAVLGIDQELVRVIAEDVGGGFGAKASVFPEELLAALASRRLRRPVRWVASRSEDGATTAQAHGTVLELELAANLDGKLRGIRGRVLHDMGAYAGSGASQPTMMLTHMISAYVLPAMQIEFQLVYTNTVPTGFIRGGGRPLGNYAIERLIDRLAHQLAVDPVELRRRNFIQPDQIPYTTGFPAGAGDYVYDSGDYPQLLDLTLGRLRDMDTSGASSEGRLIGVGVACCVESTGFGLSEAAKVHIDKEGTAHVFIGSTPQGQGHQTMVAQVAADRLGWPMERILVTAGDTQHLPFALLTAGSRSAVMVGNAISQAALVMRKQLLERAAEFLEADPRDLVLEAGIIQVRGAPARSMPATDVVPDGGLEVLETFNSKRPLTFSSSCHGAVVAVDPDTGDVQVKRYVIAHDTGKPINAGMVQSQMHGGYAHGLGYALYESAIYDPDGGFRSASLLDYTIVSTGEVATVPELIHIDTPTDSNPEGFKGAGESATIPVPATIANAVEDALRKRCPEAVVDRIPITPDWIIEILQNTPRLPA
jgi:carbon-monoxide dehydrogenase large subunit